MTNSNWTKNHIQQRWKPNKQHLLYPPVDFTNLCKFRLENREPIIVSIGQFRPEKNHALQLRAFKRFLDKYDKKREYRLVIIGSLRQQEDQKRLDNLQKLAEDLGIQNNVLFAKNLSVSELKTWLSRASIGLHTMAYEHFGIGVVEFMAAGVVPIAHNSGGPKEDIVLSFKNKPTGYLAETEEEYADFMGFIRNNSSEVDQIRPNGREWVRRFSDEAFTQNFLKIILNHLKIIQPILK